MGSEASNMLFIFINDLMINLQKEDYRHALFTPITGGVTGVVVVSASS